MAHHAQVRRKAVSHSVVAVQVNIAKLPVLSFDEMFPSAFTIRRCWPDASKAVVVRLASGSMLATRRLAISYKLGPNCVPLLFIHQCSRPGGTPHRTNSARNACAFFRSINAQCGYRLGISSVRWKQEERLAPYLAKR